MPPTAEGQDRQPLDEVPKSSSFRHSEYQVHLLRKVDQGLEDIRRERVLDQEEVEQRMDKWLDG